MFWYARTIGCDQKFKTISSSFIHAKDIKLNETSKSEKDKYGLIQLSGVSKIVKIIKTESRMTAAKRLGAEVMGRQYLFNGHRISVGER